METTKLDRVLYIKRIDSVIVELQSLAQKMLPINYTTVASITGAINHLAIARVHYKEDNIARAESELIKAYTAYPGEIYELIRGEL